MPLCKIYMSIMQIDSTLYPPLSVTNIFGDLLNRVDHRFKIFIQVGVFDVIWLLWLCWNYKVLNDIHCSLMQVIYRCSTLLFSWLSFSVCRTETYPRRWLHGWRTLRGILLPNMGGSIISRLARLHCRVDTASQCSCIEAFLTFCSLDCVRLCAS
jgi:hypothetical protein